MFGYNELRLLGAFVRDRNSLLGPKTGPDDTLQLSLLILIAEPAKLILLEIFKLKRDLLNNITSDFGQKIVILTENGDFYQKIEISTVSVK